MKKVIDEQLIAADPKGRAVNLIGISRQIGHILKSLKYPSD
jgi:hypothetical protein